MLKSWFRVVSKIASLVLGASGFLGLLSGCFVRAHLIPIDPDFELPLGRLESIGVDSDGNIYCASAYYARIQQYDSTGRYLRGWPVDTNGGVLALRINEFSQVEVFVERGDTVQTFDSNGRLLSSFPFDRSTVRQYNGLTVAADNGTLAVKYRLIAPRIVRIGADGKSRVLISTTFPALLFMGPFPAWAFFAIGLLLWEMARNVTPSPGGQ